MNQQPTPAQKEWAQHNPFERASKELIQRVQRALRQQPPKDEYEPALL